MKYWLIIVLGLLTTEANELVEEFNNANARFAANVYKELMKSNSGNFMASPLSAKIAVALMDIGAEGSTAKQLSTALQLPEDKDEIQELFTGVKSGLSGNKKYKLNVVNKVYIKDDLKIKEHFKETAIKICSSKVQNINFKNKGQTVTQINKWVEENTHNKIKDLISQHDLDGTTVAILVNAIYFQGTWLHKFRESSTKTRSFYISDEDQTDIDMMEIVETFNYYESAELNAKFLKMHYEGDDISMTFVLPNDKSGLPALEDNINEVFASSPEYNSEFVHVQIPKYKIETSVEFIPILQTLGIVDAFQPTANFNGIIDGDASLYINKILQKVFIEVDEKGTIAATTTGVLINVGSAPELEPPKQFIANHPFICYIDSPDGIMFAGRFSGN